MSRQYPYLVSGLPDPDGRYPEILAEILEELHPDDREVLRFLLFRNDNKNLLKLLRFRDGISTHDNVQFHSPAVFSFAELENMLIGEYDGDIPLPAYLLQFLEEESAGGWTVRERENRLLQLYYREGIRHHNEFIRNMFLFKQDLKNILLALNARLEGFKIERITIGNYDLPAQLQVSAAADFGLSAEYPFISTLAELLQSDRLLELEHEVDRILLSYCEEMVKLQPFSLEYILFYVLGLGMRYRWQALNDRDGERVLDTITQGILRRAGIPTPGEQTV